MQDKAPSKPGWYWVKLRGFNSGTYNFVEKWVIAEYGKYGWVWNLDFLRHHGVSDLTKVLDFTGPLERPE